MSGDAAFNLRLARAGVGLTLSDDRVLDAKNSTTVRISGARL